MPRTPAAPAAVRQRKRRQQGRAVGIVLRDPEVIAALEAGIRLHGGPLAAISAALVMAYPAAEARQSREDASSLPP